MKTGFNLTTQIMPFFSPLAIAIHALFDMPVALYQRGIIPQLWVLEIYLAVAALLTLHRAKKCYLNDCDT